MKTYTLRKIVLATAAVIILPAQAGGLLGGSTGGALSGAMGGTLGGLHGSGMAGGEGRAAFDNAGGFDGRPLGRLQGTRERVHDRGTAVTGKVTDKAQSAGARAKDKGYVASSHLQSATQQASAGEVTADGVLGGTASADRSGVEAGATPRGQVKAGPKAAPVATSESAPQ